MSAVASSSDIEIYHLDDDDDDDDEVRKNAFVGKATAQKHSPLLILDEHFCTVELLDGCAALKCRLSSCLNQDRDVPFAKKARGGKKTACTFLFDGIEDGVEKEDAEGLKKLTIDLVGDQVQKVQTFMEKVLHDAGRLEGRSY